MGGAYRLTAENLGAAAERYWAHITSHEAKQERDFAERFASARQQGFIGFDLFFDAARWKSPRPTPRYRDNSVQAVREASAIAFSAEETDRAVTAMNALAGVRTRTASALLHWMRPEEFAILDQRVVRALGEPTPSNWDDLAVYVRLNQKIVALAREMNLDLRTIDRALWTLDADKGEPLGKTKKTSSVARPTVGSVPSSAGHHRSAPTSIRPTQATPSAPKTGIAQVQDPHPSAERNTLELHLPGDVVSPITRGARLTHVAVAFADSPAWSCKLAWPKTDRPYLRVGASREHATARVPDLLAQHGLQAGDRVRVTVSRNMICVHGRT